MCFDIGLIIGLLVALVVACVEAVESYLAGVALRRAERNTLKRKEDERTGERDKE